MDAMKAFLEERLKLQVNAAKSGCARPWERKFLGYSMTNVGGRIRLKVAPQSVARLTGRVRELLRQGRGSSLTHTIDTLNPVLRGWIGYFQPGESKTGWKGLDGWLRGRLRCLPWRRAETRQRRTVMLRRQGLAETRAWHSGHDGQGRWWNSDARHMNHSFPKTFFDRLRLVPMLDSSRYLQRHS
jgi:RNA-directed DNA polymerase